MIDTDENPPPAPRPGFLWNLGIILLALVNNTASMIYCGWALQLLWGWFIVTAFGLAPLTLGGAIGILVVKVIISTSNSQLKQDLWADLSLGKTHEEHTTAIKWGGQWITGTVCLASGALWHYLLLPILGLA